jgi:hypothetical protein
MSGDTNIVGFACWFARICFAVRGVDLISSTTEFIYLLSWSPWKIGPKTPLDHVDPYHLCIRFVIFLMAIFLLRFICRGYWCASFCSNIEDRWAPSVESIFIASSALFWLHSFGRSISSDWIDPRSKACPCCLLPLIDLPGSPVPPWFPVVDPDRYTQKCELAPWR